MNQPPLAFITGSARRIGKDLAVELHEKGFNVAIHYNKSKSEAELIVDLLNKLRPNSAKCFKANLTVDDQLKEIHQQILDWQQNITVIIHNASLFYDDQLAQNNWQNLFDCNVKAPYKLSNLFFDSLKKNLGSIINITDVHAKKPLKNYDLYCMTKAALELQTQILATKFAPYVRVNSIAPGAILWPENNNGLSLSMKKKIIEQTPLKIIGGTKPILQAALHFIDNKFITGTSLEVDGGILRIAN